VGISKKKKNNTHAKPIKQNQIAPERKKTKTNKGIPHSSCPVNCNILHLPTVEGCIDLSQQFLIKDVLLLFPGDLIVTKLLDMVFVANGLGLCRSLLRLHGSRFRSSRTCHSGAIINDTATNNLLQEILVVSVVSMVSLKNLTHHCNHF
jgi:hypothetical protein